MAELATKMNKVLLSRAVLKALGIWQSNSTLIRLEQSGRFPLRVRLCPRSSASHPAPQK